MPRRMAFTLNNPTKEEVDRLRKIVPKDPQFRFLIMQGEIGEDKKTMHIQGYCEILKNQSQSYWKKLISERAHLEFAKGNSQVNIHYCSKPVKDCKCEHCEKARLLPKWMETEKYGDPAAELEGDGYWEAITMDIEDGLTNYQMMQKYPKAAGHLRKLDDIRKEINTHKYGNPDAPNPEKVRRKIRVLWIWGESGIGKTESVWDLFPDLYSVAHDYPFDFYSGQKVILWDDFREFPIDLLLTYLDVYPVQLACRYKNNWAAWNDVFITSNCSPESIYGDSAPLLRRINVVYAAKNAKGDTVFRWMETPSVKPTESISPDDIDAFVTAFSSSPKLADVKVFGSLDDLLKAIPYREVRKRGGAPSFTPPLGETVR